MTGLSSEETDPAARDHIAVEILFERHADQVWNHGYRLTGTWARPRTS
ncbi:hypothetical protein [Labedaea rhizosphaerae]|uniref:Uncharacterized protein n=1 Tax=Labedaea rhizosphaerae TaxID=598644 RepID=A0A4R6SHS9_LABRH|nr:hypothetical protein [Labedaea rhizosphaerae]TDQ01177.1 hypothetical protein EV186_1021044 [Labedaea rhizosphaerae]